MRLLALLEFFPRQPWRVSSWKSLGPYARFRLETLGRRPTPREFWSYLGWCRQMKRLARRSDRRKVEWEPRG